ncbi:MAG: class I SAM-dependent methyltransferase [Clostridiales bacterium]|nr:class I SAM-dependent methyltransferase [Clostridiales bacterium]
MQNWLTLPLFAGIRQSAQKSRLSLAQKAVVDWAKADDYCAMLDLSCSDGRLLAHFLGRYALRACGISADKGEQDQAQGLLGGAAEVLRADIHDIPWLTHSFDLVCMTKLFQNRPATCQQLAEVLRVLKPEGQLVVAVPGMHAFTRLTRRQHAATRHLDNPYNLMAALNEAGFADVSMRVSRLHHAAVVAYAPPVSASGGCIGPRA